MHQACQMAMEPFLSLMCIMHTFIMAILLLTSLRVNQRRIMHLQGMRGVVPNGAGDGWEITVGAKCRGETCCDSYKEMGPFEKEVSSYLQSHGHLPSFVAPVVILTHCPHCSSTVPCCEYEQMGTYAVSSESFCLQLHKRLWMSTIQTNWIIFLFWLTQWNHSTK